MGIFDPHAGTRVAVLKVEGILSFMSVDSGDGFQ
jgi:hypothetical protein